MPRSKNPYGMLGRIMDQIVVLTLNLEDMHRFTVLTQEDPTDLTIELENTLSALKGLGGRISKSIEPNMAAA